jgi:hypothetical protein
MFQTKRIKTRTRSGYRAWFGSGSRSKYWSRSGYRSRSGHRSGSWSRSWSRSGSN